MRTIKLGTQCQDKASGIEGMVTHWQMDMEHRVDYVFQPHGLNPEDGQPIKKILVEADRLTATQENYEDIDVPSEILGSQVRDTASGFAGMAVGFVRHINGCFHVVIQPSGRVAKTQAIIQKAEFDLRICEGEKIPKLTPEAKAASQQREPSPDNDIPDRDCFA